MLAVAARLGVPVRASSAVLSESYRGGPSDAAVDYVLGRGVRPVTMGQAMARLAGALGAREGLDSCHTVDAFRGGLASVSVVASSPRGIRAILGRSPETVRTSGSKRSDPRTCTTFAPQEGAKTGSERSSRVREKQPLSSYFVHQPR